MVKVTSQDILFYCLAVGFLVLVGFLSYAAYRLAETLESLKAVLDNIEDTTKDINLIKNKIKLGALTTLGTLIGTFLRKRR